MCEGTLAIRYCRDTNQLLESGAFGHIRNVKALAMMVQCDIINIPSCARACSHRHSHQVAQRTYLHFAKQNSRVFGFQNSHQFAFLPCHHKLDSQRRTLSNLRRGNFIIWSQRTLATDRSRPKAVLPSAKVTGRLKTGRGRSR